MQFSFYTHTHIFFLHLFYNLIIILYVTRDDVEQYLLTILSNKNLYATLLLDVFLLSHASLHVFIYTYMHTNSLAYLTELVPDFYLYLFLLLFAIFVRCTVAVCWLVLSVTYSISESLKLVFLEIETHR